VKINGNEYMLVKATEVVAILEEEPTDVSKALAAIPEHHDEQQLQS
jgi:hypothetical protein